METGGDCRTQRPVVMFCEESQTMTTTMTRQRARRPSMTLPLPSRTRKTTTATMTRMMWSSRIVCMRQSMRGAPNAVAAHAVAPTHDAAAAETCLHRAAPPTKVECRPHHPHHHHHHRHHHPHHLSSLSLPPPSPSSSMPPAPPRPAPRPPPPARAPRSPPIARPTWPTRVIRERPRATHSLSGRVDRKKQSNQIGANSWVVEKKI